MNISKPDLTKLFKSAHYGARLRPTRDWLIVLAVFLCLLLASIGWNLWTFSKVTEGEGIGEAPPPPPTAEAQLDMVNRIFDARAEEEARYRNEYRFVDPSR